MPDQSMKAWLGRLFCDAPGHITDDPGKPDFEDDFDTRVEIYDSARRAGWIFHKSGKLTCPECAKRLLATGKSEVQ